MAPRKKPIDPELVRKLAKIDCTIGEIAAVVGCCRDVLERRFRAELTLGYEQGKASIRRKQWQLAMKGSGNPTLLIWLGKNRLGQTDKSEITHEGNLTVRGSLTPEERRAALVRELSQN